MLSLCCENVVVARGQLPLFGPLSFHLLSGGALALQGANGAGKTSLLKAIASLIPLESGTVASHQDARIAYLDAGSGLNSHLTVAEQLIFVARLANTEAMLSSAIHYMRLNELLDLRIKYLSSGWRQRLMIALLMLNNALIWLLDEPEAHLDSDGLQRLLHLVQTRANDGGIVIWATHHPLVITRFAPLIIEDFGEAA